MREWEGEGRMKGKMKACRNDRSEREGREKREQRDAVCPQGPNHDYSIFMRKYLTFVFPRPR